ncbi:DUF3168 domain-containing protein [Paenibacillus dokdonensis]|uniref:DUF3168 domain-containing protein n=1 Tax=Paenibacillus dokdonensis TaxID=2567944 RepID=A0ABU6GX58_9BACL|nr:DUF3168 domain-containing protein [Paenibacillus dokdonensis]MEC0242767.1 DUF3168 domain-containing protein [Paenibacillus dokdonensis]
MIDLKAVIRQALLNNAALVSLLGGKYVYPQVSPDASIKAYVVFFEIGNIPDRYAEDQEITSDIRFQMDVWTPGNTGPIAAEVNRTMEVLGFIRIAAMDDFDDVSKIYRKILRYKKTQY